MAYISKELKAKLAPRIREICRAHGVQATLAVDNHRTLVLNIRQSSIDFIGNFNRIGASKPRAAHLPFQPAKDHISVNPYWYTEHFDGAALNFLKKVIPAMNVGNHNRSDLQTDYHDVGWYVDVNVGKWNKPYALEK